MPLDNLLLLDAPYPEIAVKKQNALYFRIISTLYAGEISELTSVNQYFYHSIILSDDYQDVSDALFAISKVENKHMLMLAQIIKKLGGDPKLRATQDDETVFWSACMANYSKTFNKIMVEDIYLEKKTIQNYKIAIECIDDEYINAAIERIILDEKLHSTIFEKILNEYK